jgi:bacteriorhodopsin
MGNGALAVNGFTNTVTVDNHITVRGSDWYWSACAVMVTSTGIFMGLAFTKPRHARIFHYITAGFTLIAAVAYFTMASNLGWTGIAVEFRRSERQVAGDIRQIFYVRHIDAFLTTPLILLDLLLTAGLPWPTILYTILIDEVMVVTFLIGALVKTSYKWGYFVFGIFAFFFVAWTVLFDARGHARNLGADINRVYTISAAWIIGLWLLYPIAWGVSEGGNVITPDSEAAFYGVLDVLSKPVFGALLLWGHRNIDISRLGLDLRIPGPDGVPSSEKATGTGATNGTSDATPATTV